MNDFGTFRGLFYALPVGLALWALVVWWLIG